jgi:membrane-associated phospholipid phosphatase
MTKKALLSKLPIPKSWLTWVLVSLSVALASGFAGTNAALLASEFELDKTINASGGGILNKLAVFASDIYSPKWAIVLILILAIAIWLVTKSRIDAFGFLAIVGAGWLPAEVFKISFNEPRPDASVLVNHGLLPKEIDSAFPSGHLCFALAIGYALYLLTKHTRAKNLMLAFWIVSSVAMGWARLYVGVHYVNDLAGSLFTSFAGVVLLAWIWNRWLFAALSKTAFFKQK